MVDWQPLALSLEVALLASLIAFGTATFSARLLVTCNFRGRDVVEGIFLLPLVLPPVVTGFVLLLLLGKYGAVGRILEDWFHWQLIFTPAAAVLASLVVAFPLMYQSAKAAFLGVDHHLEDAARSLGTNEWRLFFSITLPLAWPGLVAGLLLSFARALGEFGATIMVAGNIAGKTTTVPVAIYAAAESGDLATAGWYTLIIGCLNLVFVVGLNIWLRRHLTVRSTFRR